MKLSHKRQESVEATYRWATCLLTRYSASGDHTSIMVYWCKCALPYIGVLAEVYCDVYDDEGRKSGIDYGDNF